LGGGAGSAVAQAGGFGVVVVDEGLV